MAFTARKFFSVLNRVVREISRAQSVSAQRGTGTVPPNPATGSARRTAGASAPAGGYPGDYVGPVKFEYSPDPNGSPDPGEVVWGWVPYEEDHSRGKDRPVLLVGRDGRWLLGLMLTSKDNTNAQRQDRDYMDIGTGAWDQRGRPSEVKLDRVIRLAAQDVRREGAVLDRERFKRVAQRYAAHR